MLRNCCIIILRIFENTMRGCKVHFAALHFPLIFVCFYMYYVYECIYVFFHFDLGNENANFLLDNSVGCEDPPCDISIVTVSSLSSSKTKRPKTLFLCDFCDKTFDFKSLLERHVVKHTGQTPYKCNKCGRSFRYQGSVCNHMCKNSTDVKPEFNDEIMQE